MLVAHASTSGLICLLVLKMPAALAYSTIPHVTTHSSLRQRSCLYTVIMHQHSHHTVTIRLV